jgi:hypothetical protein
MLQLGGLVLAASVPSEETRPPAAYTARPSRVRTGRLAGLGHAKGLPGVVAISRALCCKDLKAYYASPACGPYMQTNIIKSLAVGDKRKVDAPLCPHHGLPCGLGKATAHGHRPEEGPIKCRDQDDA